MKTQAGRVHFTQPADLRRQLADVAPGTRITITDSGEHDGRKVFEVNASPHRTLRLVTDLDLLLAHTIASVRLNQRTIVFEPPASLDQCARCQEAYAEARRVIDEAGGRRAWAERIGRREPLPTLARRRTDVDPDPGRTTSPSTRSRRHD